MPTRASRATVSERVEQAHIVQLARSTGCAVVVLGVTRKGAPCPVCGAFVRGHMGTQQTPGVTDLEIWLPARPPRAPALLKWEVKAEGGRLSPVQLAYKQVCEAAGILYGVGPFAAFEAFAAEWGLIKPENIPHYRQPLK